MASSDDAPAGFAERDEHDRAEAAFWEIVAGIPKSASRNVTNAAESRRWDRLAADIARTRAEHPGCEIVKENGA